ncbi:hypothetical protein EYF80_017045 [Liparis tanakae]|uniref:Uncharacterized protein n=1 Tax=Liparis tanakae TaxID=230148 RepID=A0A4Z2I4Q7_9TELE|nr:hypothetical protein EYF80_017045 [Liparis tanakae]
MKIWVPCPRNTDSNMPFLGGRNTSPCTCFHPDSSCASSWEGRRRAIQRQSQWRQNSGSDQPSPSPPFLCSTVKSNL